MGLKLGIIREGGFLLQYLFEPVLLEAAIFDFSFLKKKKGKKRICSFPQIFSVLSGRGQASGRGHSFDCFGPAKCLDL